MQTCMRIRMQDAVGATMRTGLALPLVAALPALGLALDAAGWKQRMFHYFMDVAKRVGLDILDGKSVASGDRFLYWLGGKLVYEPLKNVLGLSSVRLAYRLEV